ncbi:MAG: peptidase T [Paludibacteraceae bacterium]|nr:peptidase T [Paludibacteraceae bacterium]
MTIVDRFLKYVSIHTTSDEASETTPSTMRQLDLARYLADELRELGLSEITMSEQGYVMATLPANTEGKPTIGFIAHMDTSPDVSGENIHPRIVKRKEGVYKGQDVIETDGTTLLGADDKAGIAEIVSAIEYLIAHPEIKHGTVRIGFTPDEEIGRGADFFDVKQFNADWAYTVDGGAIGELEFENFNAAGMKVSIEGLNVHPGYGYHKMKNAQLIALLYASMLPPQETPATTQGYEGFFHLVGMSGSVEHAELNYIIRDHDRERFEQRKQLARETAEELNKELGAGTVSIEVHDSYYNMREQIEPCMHIVELAKRAMKEAGVTPKVQPIRGGTDGARLSFMGLPCPNLFTGGENFHSRMEYIPIPSMEKAMQVIINIISLC